MLLPFLFAITTYMKHSGCTFEYERERNHDLMRAYREAIAECKVIHMPDIFRAVVNKASARFWVSEERAAIVVSHMMRGGSLSDMRPLKQEMFREIYRRVMALKEQNPDMSINQLAFFAVKQRAPKFYLTPGSAKVIICKIKKAMLHTHHHLPWRKQ